jgi:hypothetical protein
MFQMIVNFMDKACMFYSFNNVLQKSCDCSSMRLINKIVYLFQKKIYFFFHG